MKEKPDDRPLREIRLRTKWAGNRLEYHDSLDSTNNRARLLAEEGAPYREP